METLRKRIQQIKKKRPGYAKILDFYQGVKEEQEKGKSFVKDWFHTTQGGLEKIPF